MKTKITELLGIEYPIFQGGMAWVAEYHLAAAVSEAGALGIIGFRERTDPESERTDEEAFWRECNADEPGGRRNCKGDRGGRR